MEAEDRDAKIRKKFLNRDSAKDIDDSQPEVITQKSKFDFKKIYEQHREKEEFYGFFQKVHTAVCIFAGLLIALNQKHHLIPHGDNLTYTFITVEIFLFILGKVLIMGRFKELNEYLSSSEGSQDLISGYLSQNASNKVDSMLKVINVLKSIKDKIQNIMLILVSMIICLAFVQYMC